jgi:hypothetical protein
MLAQIALHIFYGKKRAFEPKAVEAQTGIVSSPVR